ncbi:chemotaxis protein CheW [Hyalangium rubrum]|uniref:Chemotaxis protein CheW n=1 Tax=Hyalangium rubrum TaxID=3103134 RepID=A0ABU5HGW9_9BACT|nr:chemotaxis protein CheW [Hyalangium sp. s54d21]MDY7232389.1 chemotaxis protein CheW [Hyalangium sp. s54d21]
MAENKTGGGLDWAQAHARLERLARTAETAHASTPEEERAVLDARARELARPPSAEKAAGSVLEVARFRSGGQLYALATRFVHEVLRDVELTPLPGAPPLLRGLTLLRGEVLPLVELAPLFGRPPTRTGDVVLVVGTTRPELGLCVDEVEEVTLLDREELLPPPTTLDLASSELMSGIHREGLILLEGEALLSDSRLIFDIADEGTS